MISIKTYITLTNVIAHIKGDLFLVGDCNVNTLIKNSNNDYLIYTIFSMGCFPLVTRQTIYGNSINSLIDNMYCDHINQ